MIRFTKMHGIGNDYVYVNGFEERVDDPESLARIISDRHFGVGGDGLILVLPPEKNVNAHVRMRMFNADGSESEMCGNGIRCVCKFAHDQGIARANLMRIQTGRGVLELSYTTNGDGKVDQVTVDMGEPILDPKRIPVESASCQFEINFSQAKGAEARLTWAELFKLTGLEEMVTCVSMGNPHAVFFCRDVDAMPLEWFGPPLENHPRFPNRMNIHLVQVKSRREITMRTWERGSGITLACGTGASAVCVAGVLTNRTDREILAHLPGGDLNLRWDEKTNHVFMTGPATDVFTGEWPTTNVS